jgi:DNA-binding transcriptional MerR regulator
MSNQAKPRPAPAPEPRKLLRISQAAKGAGVPTQTVEYYIMLGLIDPITRPPSRSRFFDERLIKRIRLIREMNESGYTLREIRTTWMRNR